MMEAPRMGCEFDLCNKSCAREGHCRIPLKQSWVRRVLRLATGLFIKGVATIRYSLNRFGRIQLHVLVEKAHAEKFRGKDQSGPPSNDADNQKQHPLMSWP